MSEYRDYDPDLKIEDEIEIVPLDEASLEDYPSVLGLPTLDDRNPASVVGVPWNEDGFAGEGLA